MGTLVLIRHGLSQFNLDNLFAGWKDVDLAARGKEDATKTPSVLGDLTFDMAFTSRLKRAQETLQIVLDGLGQKVPTTIDSALNERHYGDLQGLNKAEMIAKHGEEQVKKWRRGYDTPPPNGESIEDCVKRVTPFFKEYILPHVAAGKTVIVAAHGNSLRPIFRSLDHLDDATTATLEVQLATPYVYRFEGEKMVSKEIRPVKGIVIRVEPTGELIEQK